MPGKEAVSNEGTPEVCGRHGGGWGREAGRMWGGSASPMTGMQV